jgi:hypothetical protein
MNEGKIGLDTGTGSAPDNSRTVVVRFGDYEVQVQLGQANEFLGIVGIAIAKTFLSSQQKLRAYGSHDVDDLYDK